MYEKLANALSFISDRHIAEAAGAKSRHRPYWIGAIAAILAVVLLMNSSGLSLAVRVKAVSTADYPKYEWEYRPQTEDAARQLSAFFESSMSRSLSGSGEENTAYSPINLYMALALAGELSQGDALAQILRLLGYDDAEALRAQTREIWNACYLDDGNKTLLANSLWLDKKLSYDQTVMDTLAENYYTSVYQGDLASKSTARAIQSWLNGQTGGLLKKEVRSAGLLQDMDFPALALYSTVYYQAKWTESVEFSARNNTSGIFHAPGGDISCTFMNKKELNTNYYWGEDYGAVALGLKDGSRMWLVLPDAEKTVEDVLSSGEYLRQVLVSDRNTDDAQNHKFMRVNLSLPKFDIRTGGNLAADLKAMGVTDIFDREAGAFEGTVDGDFPVWLTAINQATRVAIDEKGVTAASYIELPGAGAAAPPEEVIDFVLDRPFLFVVTNRYGLPLFAGVVNEP